MTANEYLFGILARECVDTSLTSPVWSARQALMPILAQWGGTYLQRVDPSGSFAKGTANRSGTDVDLFVSLSPNTPNTLKEIHDTLCVALVNAGYAPRRQNVSIGVRVGAVDVDLVPGKQQNFLSSDHSLYRRKANTWTKTNVQTHIAHVQNNGRLMESRILKLWRTQHRLDFPSFYLELAVIEALRKGNGSDFASRVWATFQYLAGNFSTARIVDPANTNNVISDDLTAAEKRAIKAAAAQTLQLKTWGEVVK
jgi:hypothetical protein